MHIGLLHKAVKLLVSQKKINSNNFKIGHNPRNGSFAIVKKSRQRQNKFLCNNISGDTQEIP